MGQMCFMGSILLYLKLHYITVDPVFGEFVFGEFASYK